MVKRKLIKRSVRNGKIKNFGNSAYAKNLLELILNNTSFVNNAFYIASMPLEDTNTNERATLYYPRVAVTYCYSTYRRNIK